MITWADVVLIAPELSAVASGAQTAIIADVYAQLDSDTWGTRLDRGAKYLAAHLGALTRRGGAAGPVTSQTVGGVSQSYAVPSVLHALTATAYGAEFERLCSILPGARFAIG